MAVMAVQIAPNAARTLRLASAKHNVSNWLSIIVSLLLSFNASVTSSKAVFSKLLEIPLTVIGLICINVFFYEKCGIWSWLTSGITVIILEAMIADKDDA